MEFGPPVQKNTIHRKGATALTARDKLRLTYVTGQDDDPEAPPDKYAFTGQNKEEVDKLKKDVALTEKRIRNQRPR